MPIIAPTSTAAQPEDRLRSLLLERREADPSPQPQASAGFLGLGLLPEHARQSNIVGSFLHERVSRVLSGQSFFRGGPLAGEWIPRQLGDPAFYEAHPYAVQGYDALLAAQSPDEFETTLHVLRQNWDDYRAMGEAGFMANIVPGMAANIADPINFVPVGNVFGRVEKGVGTARTIRNVMRAAGAAAASNVIQEEALNAISSGRPVDRLEADIAAAATGAGFGGLLGWLSSPTQMLSRKQVARVFPSDTIADIRTKLDRAFESEIVETIEHSIDPVAPAPGGQARALQPAAMRKPRNVVTAMEDGEAALRDLLKKTPTRDEAVPVLLRRSDPQQKIAGDLNAQLADEVQAHYAKAGKRIDILRHPLQDDYDAFTPLERSLNEAMQEWGGAATGAKAAGAKELAEGIRDTIAMSGTSLIAKGMSLFTPMGALERSAGSLPILDTIRRVFFYDGTVSQAAAADPTGFKGVTPAEAFKDVYQARLAGYLRDVREAYNPALEHGLLFGRDEADRVAFTGFKKAAAWLNREAITYTDAAGNAVTIPARNAYADFQAAAVKVMREQKAIADGFITESRQAIPPALQKAVDSTRKFYDDMLDAADQVGLLPGKRALRQAEADAATANDELEAVFVQVGDDLDKPLAPAEAHPTPGVKEVFTGIDREWIGRKLYAWGRNLRADQEVRIGGRRRVNFDTQGMRDLVRVRVGDPTLIRTIKLLTDEVWAVHERRGKFWRREYYLVPKRVIERARQLVDERARLTAEAKVRAAETKLETAEARLRDVQDFNDAAKFYFTRRFIRQNVETGKKDFKAWLVRSWRKARDMGYDPETGERFYYEPGDRPLIDDVRDNLRIDEDVRTEGDLAAKDADLFTRYGEAVNEYFDRQAEGVYTKIVDPQHEHGVEHSFAGGSPLMKRTLELDESDPAAARFLDGDLERVTASYTQTVGGRIAAMKAIKEAQAAGWLGTMGDKLKTPEDFTLHVKDAFRRMVNQATEIDRATGSSHAVRLQRDAHRATVRLDRRLADLLGTRSQQSDGAHAFMEWAGSTALKTNYLAMLGSQVLSMINDVASVTLFADVTSVPRNVKAMVKAIAPLKTAAKRDLQLMGLAFEAEQSRVLTMGDIDSGVQPGVGFGATRKVTGAISVGLDRLTRAFNEVNLANPWNRYIRRAAAYIAMDRITQHSRRLIRMADEGLTPRDVGLSNFDAAWLAQRGINAETARKLMGLLHRYGTDENGQTMSAMYADAGDMAKNHKGVILPDAGRWLAEEGDAVRPLYETYTSAVSFAVDRAMIIRPGLLDRPLMNDNWWGKLFNQFSSFAFAWGNLVARPLAQRPAGRQIATIFAYMGTGAMVDAIRNHLSGRRTFDETAALWQENPAGMTYAVVNSSGITGVFNRPLAFFDRMGVGPGAMLRSDSIAAGPFRGEGLLGSLSPVADLAERTFKVTGAAVDPNTDFQLRHWHMMRRSVPLQNLIWFRLSNRLMGFDPLLTERLMEEQRRMRPRTPTP